MANVTIKLTVGAFSAEVAGPQEYAEQKLNDLVEKYFPPQLKTSPVAETQPASAVVSDAAGKKLSPAEFLKKISHTNQLDRALALGYYLEKVGGANSFTTKEILELSRQVKYPFANVSESVSRLIGRGLMMSAGDKEGGRAYALTATGEQMIDSMASKV